MKRRLGSGAAALTLSLWALTAGVAHAGPQSRGACSQAVEGLINLPADDSVHEYTPYSIEWWYWTAHLKTADGRQFGFAKIVYTSLASPESTLPLQWSDATVSDIAAEQYHFGGRAVALGPAASIENGFEFDIGTDQVKGGNGSDEIHSIVDDGSKRYEVNIRLEAQKAPVVQMAAGYIYYYSRPRMKVSGTLTTDGEVSEVTGYAWFDHQFGDQKVALADVQNWTWMAVQLDGHRELIVLVARFYDGTQLVLANLSEANCQTTRFEPEEIELTPTGGWTPPDGVCEYELGWDVDIESAGIHLHVTPEFAAQDIWVPGWDRYWEGAATVSGSDRGRAYIEMFGFCPW